MRSPYDRTPRNECARLAFLLARRPANRDGADKTWVLQAMINARNFFSGARLLPRKKGDARLR